MEKKKKKGRMTMKKLQRAAALIIGLLIAVLVLGCDNSGTDKPKDPGPQKPKITLNYEPVKLEQGKELSLAKINNTDKIVITKTFHRTGTMTKIGDTIYIRNANTGTILEAKLEDDNLKITNAEFVKDVPEESFLSNDGKELIYTDAKRKVNAVASDGTSKPFYEKAVRGMVGVPGKDEAVSFYNAQAIVRYAVADGKVSQEIGTVIPKERDKLLTTPDGLACDGQNVYLFGSTLDGKMSVGAVAAYSLDGTQAYILGRKDDPDRKPGFLASAFDVAVTDDYLFVFDGNIRKINIFNKKDGSFVDRISADKLFDGQNDVQMMPYEGNQVLAIVKDKSSKNGESGDKVFMLKL